ncbi:MULTISPECIES: SHOCT domain-containing protein [Streptosporangium]|uniref:Membrane protein n=1 Tax=Streptosporangium brasiliense TaxID=47480 RepID=A0ABT9RJ07_9ACTN|nr:SHOCT domain-containing protein [Streptosporangium brasiliense]MDP9868791.1 putative membrane protein [Streptosporangium brasiliense]
MMPWYDHDLSGWGWGAMSVGMILFWALVIAAVVALVRALNRPQGSIRTPAGPTPERLLAERFARGEIDEEDYRRRLAALHTSGHLTGR